MASRARNGVLPWGMVYFRFFTSQRKYATECTIHCKCPFCRLSAGTFTVSAHTFPLNFEADCLVSILVSL